MCKAVNSANLNEPILVKLSNGNKVNGILKITDNGLKYVEKI